MEPLAGFLDNKTGQVRTKEQLAKADQRVQREQSTDQTSLNDTASQQDFSARVVQGVNNLRGKFVEQANSAIGQVNERLDAAGSAQKLVKEQIKVAKELKQIAKEGGSKEAFLEKRAELDKLLAAGREKEEEIAAVNRPNADDGTVSFISVGNNVRGLPKIDEVQFQASQKTGEDLNSVDDINELIGELKTERRSLIEQRRELRTDKREIRETVKIARKDLNEAKEGILGSIDQADRLAQKIVGQLRSENTQPQAESIPAGSQEFLVHRLDEAVVQALVES